MSLLLFYPSRSIKLLLLGCILLITLPGNKAAADPTYSLRGVVLDGGTGTGLAGAHVFLLESTLGTVTDEEGHFSLTNLQPGEYQIGISMVGYVPYTLKVNMASASERPFEITLTPQVYQLADITVTAKKNRRWKRQLENFTLQVIGDSDNAPQTRIINPEVLNFIQRKSILIAEASEPLVIENRALGYRIHYTLVHCAIQHGLPQYKGIARFEELTPKNKKERRRWRRNRERAYKGSFKHLLRSLAKVQSIDDLAAEGFRLAHVPDFPKSMQSYERAIWQSRAPIDEYVQKTPATHENLLQVEDFLLITYSGEMESDRYVRNQLAQSRAPDVQRSSIEVRPKSTVFHENGFLYDAYSVVLHGYMGWERIADMLPMDYSPSDG